MKLAVHVVAIVLLAIAIIAGEGFGAWMIATREPAPKRLTPDRIEAASRPAIMLIQSDFAASVSVPDVIIPDAKYNQLVDKLQAMVNAGQLTSDAQVDRAAIDLVASNPGAYYAAGDSLTSEIDYGGTGSAFFVTDHGYLVTAAHVVTSSKSEARDESVATYKDPENADQDRADLAKGLLAELGLTNSGVAVTAAEQDRLEAFWQTWVARYLTVKSVDATFRIESGTVQVGDQLDKSGLDASIVSVDPSDTGRDIAIMKANISGVPTLPLAGGFPQMGEATYAIGYPGLNGSSDAVISESMTSGRVQKTDDHGSWTAYGTTATLRPGASGGPVIDASGKVMGIVSYSRVDSAKNQVYGGGFFIPSAYISDDLAAAKVHPQDSPTDITNTYYHAFAEGDIHRYKTELPLLKSILARTTFDAYIRQDIDDTEKQIAAGRDRTPPDLSPYLPYALAGAGGAVVLTMLLWLVLAASMPLPKRTPQESDLDKTATPDEMPTG